MTLEELAESEGIPVAEFTCRGCSAPRPTPMMVFELTPGFAEKMVVPLCRLCANSLTAIQYPNQQDDVHRIKAHMNFVTNMQRYCEESEGYK